MPYSINYDALNKIVLGSFSGQVDRNLFRQYSLEVVKICRETKCKLILTDYLEATFTFSVVELYRLPEKHDQLLNSLGVNIHTIKRAALFANEYYEMAAFYENVAVNRGQKFKFFKEKSDALDWLLSGK